MKPINIIKDLSENEKTVITIISELETREKNPKTKEITISENLKITLTADGIKQLKMISEKNIDSDKAIEVLISKDIVTKDGLELKLSENGRKMGKVIRSEQMSNWYNNNLLKCAESKAYAEFCTKVFGKNLSQFNVLDMEQLDTLISSLDLKSDDSVLDLGSGLGKIAEYIHKSTGAKIIGIDFAEELVNWANDNTNSNNGELAFFVGNINNLKYPQSTFNAIYAIDTLYPSNIDDLEGTIATLKKILTPNGQMGIFFAQIIESKESVGTLHPNNTQMAIALKKNGLNFTTIDFTQNARDIWERELKIGNELREQFEKEGNLDLYKDRIADGERCIFRIDNQLQKRYFYHVQK